MNAISRFLFVAMLAVVSAACTSSGKSPDNTLPVIALTGENPQIIAFGEAYVELGATASDNRSDDLTTSIVIDSTSVDTSTPGDYTVTYSVTDAAANVATVTRTVTVRPPAPEQAEVLVSGDIKKLIFSWEEVQYAESYRLYENPDGHSGFSQLGEDIPAGTLSASQEIAVHLFDWGDAQYLLEACNVTGCSTSDVVAVTGVVLETIGYFKASNTDPDDSLQGFALSVDGKTLAAGASREDSCATGINGDQSDNSCENSGAVYLFRLGENGWYQQAYIKASNTDIADRFRGQALSADGNTLAVSAGGEDSCATGVNGDQDDNSCENSGAVYLFRFGENGWYQQAYIKSSNADPGDGFGAIALSSDGNTLAVSTSGEDSCATGINGDQDDESCEGAGAVYLFRFLEEEWNQEAYIKASNTGFGQESAYGSWHTGGFGSRIRLNAHGDTLIVASRVGLYVFRYEASGWREQAYLNWNLWADGVSDVAVDAAGNTVAVSWVAEYYGGWVNVYRFEDNDWNLYADIWRRPMTDPEYEYYLVPGSLVLSADGQRLTVSVGLEYWQEHRLIDFLYADAQSWNRQAPSFHPPNWSLERNWDDRYGSPVALSADGNTLIVSASGEGSCATGINGDQDDNSCRRAGAVYVY